MQTDTITIQGLEFVVPVRYAEGHVVTANEAAALNQTYHENLRNNFANTIRAKKEELFGVKGEDGKVSIPDDAALDDEQLSELQSRLDAYAAEYEFARRTGGGRAPADPVEKEALNLAKQAIRTALRSQNRKADADTIEAAAKQLVDQNPLFRETARQRVEQQNAIAQGALGDILGNVEQPQG